MEAQHADVDKIMIVVGLSKCLDTAGSLNAITIKIVKWREVFIEAMQNQKQCRKGVSRRRDR